MTQQRNEEVIGDALSVVMNLISLLADACVARGVISNDELIGAVKDLSSKASHYGENEAMARMLLGSFLARYEKISPEQDVH